MILTYPYGKFYNTALRYTVIIAHSPYCDKIILML